MPRDEALISQLQNSINFLQQRFPEGSSEINTAKANLRRARLGKSLIEDRTNGHQTSVE